MPRSGPAYSLKFLVDYVNALYNNYGEYVDF
jgi:hypothetical protein